MTTFADFIATHSFDASSIVAPAKPNMDALAELCVRTVMACIDRAMSHEAVSKYVVVREDICPNVLGLWYVDKDTDEGTNARKELAKQGWLSLGQGHFSVAFAHNDFPDVVVKVSLREGDAGAAYAAWCRDQKAHGNEAWHKHIPTVHGAFMMKGVQGFVLDKLAKVQSWMPETDANTEAWDLVRPLEKTMFGYYRNYIEYSDAIEASCVTHAGNDTERLDMQGLLSPDTLYSALNRVGSFFKGIAAFDLHDDNMMVHADGHLVITDPVSYTRSN